MGALLEWLSKRKNQAYALAFALIILPPLGLFFFAESRPLSLAMLALIVLGNLLAVLIR
jgi:hypothetical protein